MNPLVSIQLVVKDGERFIRHCLDAVRAQTYPELEVVIFDNASSDRTRDIVRAEYPEYRLVEHPVNLGMWPAQELVLSKTTGAYVLALSVDVILDRDFVANAVRACQSDRTIAAVQAKVYQYDVGELAAAGRGALRRTTIDTCGFALSRGRGVINIGHGAPDGAEYDHAQQVLGVEGAAPFFRRDALEDCRVNGALVDPDYFWYGDDLDLAWRMTLFGHRQMFVPDVVAWHDRSTTKGTAGRPVVGQLARRNARRSIPEFKRRLDWSNVRFTIIKNDLAINILRDLPRILVREAAVLGYTVLFEPGVLREAGRFFRLLPVMLRRRRQVMARAALSPGQMRHFFV